MPSAKRIPPAEFDQRDHQRGHVRRGKVESREEVRDFVEMRELAPAILR